MHSDLFAGTARYYESYRPRYPEQLFDDLLARTVGENGDVLVDLGSGTGEVAVPLAAHFGSVLAVEPDPDMLALGRAKTERAGITNVEWWQARAEDVPLPEHGCDLITAGSSFHWMDRDLLSARFRTALTGRGAVAVLGGSSSPWGGSEAADWHEAALAVLRRWLGEERRAGNGTYAVNKQHADYLEPAGFRVEPTLRYPTRQRWTIEDYLGYLYSTSFAGLGVIGENREAFERDLRSAMADHTQDDGTFEEVLEFYCILAFPA